MTAHCHSEGAVRSVPARRLVWRKSSYSNGAGGECVECASGADSTVFVRDSKCADGAVLVVGGGAWARFLGGLGSVE
ncbi:DUF397 domain-containing protein [Streptomyces sp. NPDC057694]|uniref:DUF397 domain-containing protein n=1 Tax=Streptomyces sp. NPDC057694 TaxID=3346216 RepID=UPI0036C7179A